MLAERLSLLLHSSDHNYDSNSSNNNNNNPSMKPKVENNRSF